MLMFLSEVKKKLKSNKTGFVLSKVKFKAELLIAKERVMFTHQYKGGQWFVARFPMLIFEVNRFSLLESLKQLSSFFDVSVYEYHPELILLYFCEFIKSSLAVLGVKIVFFMYLS